MQIVEALGFQGDVCFRRVHSIPAEAVARPASSRVVVAHSETGHDHYVTGEGVVAFDVPARPLVCYLRSELLPIEVRHARSFDTHATFALSPGIWEVRREREYVPGGFRRVED